MNKPDKPKSCAESGCPLAAVGRGFVLGVGDPRTAKLAVNLEAPGKDEVAFNLFPHKGDGERLCFNNPVEAKVELTRRKRDYPDIPVDLLSKGAPIVGRTGEILHWWTWPAAGVKFKDLFVDNTIRCLPPKEGENNYPTGEIRKRAEQCCFDANTSVLLADKTWKAITETESGDFVLSVDNYGRFIKARVTKRVRLPRSANDHWVRVYVDGAYNRGAARWGSPGVRCTDDHVWYGPMLAKPAKRLRRGDVVYLPRTGNSELIHGTILGDAYVRIDGKLFTGLKITHANRRFAKRKAQHLSVALRPKWATIGKKKYRQWELCAPIPRFWRRLFYRRDGSKKWVAPQSDAALAVWYCDDGNLKPNRTGGKSAAQIAVHAFRRSEKEAIRLYLARLLGTDAVSLYEQPRYTSEGFEKGNSDCAVVVLTEAASLFFSRIAPFVPPEMYYKLPMQFQGQYNGWLEEKTPQLGHVIRVKKTKPYRSGTRYCLVVEGTESFFTRAGLVSNCRQYDRWHLMKADCAVISFHPAGIAREGTPLPLLVENFRKAMSFVAQKMKVVVLCGGKAVKMWLGRGENVTFWQGDYETVGEPRTKFAKFDPNEPVTKKREKKPRAAAETREKKPRRTRRKKVELIEDNLSLGGRT